MRVMARRRVVWVLSLPLAAVGWLTAHFLAYMLVAPEAGHRTHLLSEAGHGYLGAAPLMAACAVTLLVAGLALAVREGMRDGRAPAHVPVWPIALVPPLGFAVQEHLERVIELNAFPFGAALEPTFIVGMAMQVPFALGAVLLTRAVLALGHALGRRLARTARPPTCVGPPPLPAPPDPELARRSVLATGHCERAPPLPDLA
jgi:hypothetical protein